MILSVQGLSFSYKSTAILKDISFELNKGELLAILGPNGVGKTSLLKCLNALHKYKLGTVLLRSQNIRNLTAIELAKECAYVPQAQSISACTVFDSVLLGRSPHIRYRVSKKDLEIVDAALKRLKIEHLALRYTDELSGGEQQKVAFARALVQEPHLLLLDEPTSALDLLAQTESLKMLKHIVEGHDMTAIMTMHDINLALRYAHKCLFLSDGKILAACKSSEVTAEIISQCYGLEVEILNHNGIQIIIPKTNFIS